MEDVAGIVGEHDHVLRIDDLLEQHIHHRLRMGQEVAALLDLFREHHTITFDLARKHGIACDAVQSGYLHATTRESVFDKLKAKSVYWKEEQGQQVEWLEGADVQALTGSKYFGYGVLYSSGGRVNPYLFTNGLIAAATARGARVFGESEAIALSRSGNRWRVATAQGAVVADRVVFCTNAYATAIVPQFADNFYPLTAYAVSTKPLPRAALDIVMPSRASGTKKRRSEVTRRQRPRRRPATRDRQESRWMGRCNCRLSRRRERRTEMTGDAPAADDLGGGWRLEANGEM